MSANRERGRPATLADAVFYGAGPSMPAVNRGSMVAVPWRGLRSLRAAGAGAPTYVAAGASADAQPLPWERAAKTRRRVLIAWVLASTLLAAAVLAQLQPAQQSPLLQWLQVGLFSLLFGWVAAGCFTAVIGFRVVLRGDPHAMSKHSAWKGPLDPGARTALIMPICNEDVTTVFSGLRATCESLLATGEHRHFDLFILSDSSDPAVRAAELAAWADLRQALGGGADGSGGQVYYRWRQRRTRRKAGNVADFCRRWGRSYRYMVVMDADSVMSGDCLVTLLRLMEAHPKAGILQTAPQTCGPATVHARGQQFASRVAGRLFTAGMQYWQLGEAHYWGHNAIIRVEPFMRHCALATIERGPLRGDILSHDFVEAALMRRAGYHVWLVHDLVGSYEQPPPHLLAELQRDRRWCQGNLQNARLISEPGLHAVHRGMLLSGAMAYLSAPLWLLYMAMGSAFWVLGSVVFRSPAGMMTLGVAALWVATIALLALPRVLGVTAILLKGEQRFYGGRSRLLASAAIEATLALLQAPLRMVAHTMFVIGALTGWRLDWKSPPREANDVGWAQATRQFASAALAVLVLAGVLLQVSPSTLPWLLPVGLPLLLAIPVTVLTSRAGLGRRLRNAGLLLVPEEGWSPRVVRRAQAHARTRRPVPGWTELLANPRLCALVMAAIGRRRTSQGLRGALRRTQVCALAAFSGDGVLDPQRLDIAQRMRFMSEPGSLQQLRAAMLFPAPQASAR